MNETDASAESSSVRETTAQIRFGLSQLTAQNAHHEFESLTRTLARATVSRNILPATGPVGAGGDQGRDFETFRSYIAGEIQSVGRDLGVSDGDRIGFSCTLQSGDIRNKIKDDVEQIASQGEDVDFIIYYCETNVPVARRHELQEWARTEHGVHLEIFDGTSIAELFAQRHLYWIAQEFLHLPAMALPGPERVEWYEKDLRRWREETRVPATFGDLVDLSGCLRYSAFHDEASEDIQFWLGKIDALLRVGLPRSIRQPARYEVVVANFRGLGDMRPVDEQVVQYFDLAVHSDDPSELGDAATLLMYCIGAKGRGFTAHDEATLRGWNLALQKRVEELVRQTDLSGRKSSLLETLGWLRAQPDIVMAREEGTPYELEPESPRISLDEMHEWIASGIVDPIDVPVMDLSGAYDAWLEMVDVMESAPLFPVEHIATLFHLSGHILSKDDRYDQVVTAIDRRVAQTAGQAVAAEHARDRAMMFYDRGQLLNSLREFHRVRLGWFSGETSHGLILAMLMTSQVYRQLHLAQAAKYSALAAARLVQESDRELVARALFKAAEADYHQAAWLSTVGLIETGLRAHAIFEEDPYNPEKHRHLRDVIFELLIIRAMAKAAGRPYSDFVDESIKATGIDRLMDDLVGDLDQPPWWEGLDPDQLHQRAADQLGHPPFSDGGATRSIAWSALGVHWTVQCVNQYDSVIVAERVAAVGQMLLAELAFDDPCLLPTRVSFEVLVGPSDDNLDVKVMSDGKGTRCRARVPSLDPDSPVSHKKAIESVARMIMAAVAEVSVLPGGGLTDVFNRRVEEGLLDNLMLGVAYDAVIQDAMKEDDFNEALRRNCSALNTSAPPRSSEHSDLKPSSPAAPFYTKERSLELASSRYKNTSEALIATLPALRTSEPFGRVVESLRRAGWKDWHILLAVFHVAQNNRFQFRAPANEADAREMFRQFTSPEEPGQAAPLELFTEDALRDAIKVSWASTLKVWGLEVHQNPVDIDAVEELLATRFAYWEDDPPHSDPFVDPGDRSPQAQ